MEKHYYYFQDTNKQLSRGKINKMLKVKELVTELGFQPRQFVPRDMFLTTLRYCSLVGKTGFRGLNYILKLEPLGTHTQIFDHTGHIKGEDINNVELFKDISHLYESLTGNCNYSRVNHLLI